MDPKLIETLKYQDPPFIETFILVAMLLNPFQKASSTSPAMRNAALQQQRPKFQGVLIGVDLQSPRTKA